MKQDWQKCQKLFKQSDRCLGVYYTSVTTSVMCVSTITFFNKNVNFSQND